MLSVPQEYEYLDWVTGSHVSPQFDCSWWAKQPKSEQAA
jgi:hypothetical protein